MRVFIIGPGGVGKTTSGKILAQKLDYNFVDLDDEFCRRIKNIGSYIKNSGYEKYCYRNSNLFFTLLNENKKDVVIPLSSGFLIHKGLDTLVEKYHKTIKQQGVSILLLPSRSLKISEKIVVRRQLNRGFELEEEREREKIRSRFQKYKILGDIKIFSHNPPETIANSMYQSLNSYKMQR